MAFKFLFYYFAVCLILGLFYLTNFFFFFFIRFLNSCVTLKGKEGFFFLGVLLSNLIIDVLGVMKFSIVCSGKNSGLCNRRIELKVFCLRG